MLTNPPWDTEFPYPFLKYCAKSDFWAWQGFFSRLDGNFYAKCLRILLWTRSEWSIFSFWLRVIISPPPHKKGIRRHPIHLTIIWTWLIVAFKIRHKALYPVLFVIHFRGLLKNVMTNLANQRNSTKASFTELFGDSRLSIFFFNLVYDLGKIIFQDNRVTHNSMFATKKGP